VGVDSLGNSGVLYHGLEILGGGATLAGMVLGAIAVFVIERDFIKAAAFSFVGAGLTFFGLIHGESVGFGQTPSVATSYLLLTGFLVGIARFAHPERDVSTVSDVPDSLTDVAAAEAQ